MVRMTSVMQKTILALLIAAVGMSVLNTDTASADPHRRPSSGSLNGKRIMVSPGHGWTWQNTSNFWYTQRGVNNGCHLDGFRTRTKDAKHAKTSHC